MSEKRNYQKELDRIISENEKQGLKKKLLLHVCCAPCSSYCMEYLTKYFEITLLFYNPNMDTLSEYEKRAEELKRLIEEARFPVNVMISDYDPSEYYDCVKGLENLPEGSERCFRCYKLRLEKAAREAAEKGFDYFTTTLSISPYKNAEKINEIGEMLAEEYGIRHLPSDFKKRNGYKRSIELSHQYDLYRQDYCGCVFSKEVRNRVNNKTEEGK